MLSTKVVNRSEAKEKKKNGMDAAAGKGKGKTGKREGNEAAKGKRLPPMYCACGCYKEVVGASNTFHLAFKGGQKVWMAGEGCLLKVQNDFLSSFMTGSSFETLPKSRMKPQYLKLSATINCPVTGHEIKVNDHTPNLLFVGGQVLFFLDFSSLSTFVRRPTKFCLAPKKTLDFRSAVCLCGKKLLIDATTLHTQFNNGQRVFACSEKCKNDLMGCFSGNVLSEFVQYPPLEAPLPNLGGLLVGCPRCNRQIVVKTDTSPRIQLKSKQTLYFCSNKCVEACLRSLELFQGLSDAKQIHQRCVEDLSPEPPVTPHTETQVLGVQTEPNESADLLNA